MATFAQDGHGWPSWEAVRKSFLDGNLQRASGAFLPKMATFQRVRVLATFGSEPA